jgi:hypothetical protein
MSMGSLTQSVLWALLCQLIVVFYPESLFADNLSCLQSNLRGGNFSAQCSGLKNSVKARPSSITGDGYTVGEFASVADLSNSYQVFLEEPFVPRSTLKHEAIDSPLGLVHLLYPYSFREMLKEDPGEVVKGALSIAEQLFADTGFLSVSNPEEYQWHIVVVSSVPKAASTGLLSSSSLCHTAWTGPPATIVIAGDRLGTRCGKGQLPQREVISAFKDVLFHEFAHVIEFRLMGEGFGRRKRWHGEGFAMWFEALVKQKLQGEAGVLAASEKKARAKEVFSRDWHEYLFSGTTEDYLQSYGRIAVIAETQSVSRLAKIYQRMSSDNCSFAKAVELELGWDDEQWADATASFLGL